MPLHKSKKQAPKKHTFGEVRWISRRLWGRWRLDRVVRPSSLWKVAVFLVGIGGGYWGLRPHVTVAYKDELRKGDPFSVPFEITNAGHFSVYSVRTACETNHVLSENRNVFLGGETADLAAVDDEIEPGVSSTHFCDLEPQPPGLPYPVYKETVITLRVSFRPSFWPWTVSKPFRFRGYKGDDKDMHWRPDIRKKGWF